MGNTWDTLADTAGDWYSDQQEAASERRNLAYDAAFDYEGERFGSEDSYDPLEEGTFGRDTFDWAMDYEGEWRGGTDDHDVMGPSVWEDEGDGYIDWRNPDSEDDPTNPDNNWLLRWILANPTKVLLLTLGVGGLVLLRPYAGILAGIV